jgi:two-component SAPR family response regulator
MKDEEKNVRLHIQTFGNFEVFLDGKPLFFCRSKTKELFAYLVSKRGALCTNNEIIDALWEAREDKSSLKSMLRTLVADLIKTLSKAGIQDVVVKHRGYVGITKEKIICDLYDYLSGEVPKSYYMGEYMTQYSWAETTNTYLERIQEGIFARDK